MDKMIAMQFLALSLYALFAGFCFCDGFGLTVRRKLVWFTVLFLISLSVLKIKGEYDLALILPVPTLLAILLCYREKQRSKR